MNKEPIVIEQTFHVPPATVWKAITDQDQMRQWFFEAIAEFKPEVGFETEFDVLCEEQTFAHQWRVTDVIPKSRIVYDWRYGGYDGYSSVSWDLSERPDGTNLILTHRGHETFSQDSPVFSRENGVAGWNYFVKERLSSYLQRQTKPE